MYNSIGENFFNEKNYKKYVESKNLRILPIFSILKKNNLTIESFHNFTDVHDILKIFTFIKKSANISCYIFNRKAITKEIIDLIKKKSCKDINIDYLSETNIKNDNIELYIKALKNQKKYDCLYINLGTINGVTTEIFENNHSFNSNLLMGLILCLNMQNNNGCCFFRIPLGFSKFTIQLVYILKKYYKKIILTNIYSSKIGLAVGLYLVDFMSVSNEELCKFDIIKKKMCENKDYFGNNNKIIESIFNIDENNVNYSLIKVFLLKFENDKINDINHFLSIQVNKNKFIENKKIMKKKRKVL
jgi:hypothetical protein